MRFRIALAAYVLRACLLVVAGWILTAGRLLAGLDFSQCANKSPTLGNCVWIGSVLHPGNSQYFEGMSTPQRILITDLSAGSHTLTIITQDTKSSTHAYDWLDSWPQASTEATTLTGTALTFNECSGLNGAKTTACNAVVAAGFSMSPTVPGDTFVSAIWGPASAHQIDGTTQTRIIAFTINEGTRTLTIKGDASITAASFSAVSHTSDKAGATPISNGGDTGDSYEVFTLNWTSGSANVLIEFAAHIGKGTDTVDGWGPGNGASGVQGAPYHVILGTLDGSNTGLGGADNQLSVAAAPTPTSTPTNTPTSTATITPTNTPTSTPTNTQTNTPTSNATPIPGQLPVVPTLSFPILGLLALALLAAGLFVLQRS